MRHIASVSKVGIPEKNGGTTFNLLTRLFSTLRYKKTESAFKKLKVNSSYFIFPRASLFNIYGG